MNIAISKAKKKASIEIISGKNLLFLLVIALIFIFYIESGFSLNFTKFYSKTNSLNYADIKVLNEQSYPSIGGNWTVKFETTGKSDLFIKGINGTNFGDDLIFLEIKCGNEQLDYETIDNGILVKNYECIEGSETAKVLTGGNHTLSFVFGDKEAYAFNQANTAPVITYTNISTSDFRTNNTFQNITWNFNVTDAENDAVFNTTCNIFENGVALILSVFNFNINGTDCSGFANHGALQGNAAINTGNGSYGAGVSFDGLNSKVNTTTRLNTNLISVEMWFKPNQEYTNASGSGLSVITYQSNEDYEIMINNGSLVFAYKGWNISSTTVNFTKGKLYYIAAIFDGDNQSLYINGVLESNYKVKAFTVRNATDSALASFYNSGDIILRGTCQAQATCAAPVDSFIFQNSTGTTLFSINSTGGLCTIDDCSGRDSSCDNPGDGSFIVRNLQGDNVAYVNATGKFCFRGGLTQNEIP